MEVGRDLVDGRWSDGVVALGPFTPADAAVVVEGDRDAEHRRRFHFPEGFTPTLEHARGVIEQWERDRLAGERFPFAVRDAATGELLGGCELLPPDDGAANLSFWTYPPHRRRGIASRAVALACSFAFRVLGAPAVRIVAEPDNAGSRRAALRNGFREVGEVDGMVVHLLQNPGDRPGRGG